MLLKKKEQETAGLHPDLLIEIPNGNFVVEINQRSELDMLRMMQSYMEMDREVSLPNA